jgi:hypothetical protein
VVHSDNILTESNPEQLHWEMLPDGDVGVWNPDLGSVQEEQNIEVLNNGTLYMVNRTEIGHPAYATSRDGGHTWTVPQVMTYANGRPIKTPRACPRVWKASNGKFLFWFHNNSYPGWGNSANRNPVWVAGGVEADGEIQWSQPEILLYSPDPTMMGMSYPDFIEQGGRYWVAETQKDQARVHEIDIALLEGLWNQHTSEEVAREGLVFESDGPLSGGDAFDLPRLPNLQDGGLTLDLWVQLDSVESGQILLDSFGKTRRGFRVSTAAGGALKLELWDGKVRRWLEALDGPDPSQNVRSVRVWNWSTDAGTIRSGQLHHVAFIVDGRANIASVVVDGVLCDGGESRIQGWWRLSPYLGDLNGDGRATVGEGLAGRLERVRIYDRYLRTSEAVSNHRAGAQ